MKKLLFIVPHLSTGGMPQFVLKQIEILSAEYDISLIEWENITGGVYVVQRNAVEKILGENFYSLSQNKTEMLSIISDIEPDIVHFHEIPETFVNNGILDKLYSDERKYRIVVTTHSSLTDPSSVKYTADRYVLVSEWSKDVFESHFKGTIDCEVWEYPIEKYEYDKKQAKSELGWDKDYKHILNVGLFTRGKNQGELFDLAREFEKEKVIFHFVGNQAVNFKDYWGPIMENVPKNCIVHGERNDVDKFYRAADLFYFTSNFELSPLAVKEALSYGLPTFIKRLHTYKDMYDGKVVYITGSKEKNKSNVIDSLSGVNLRRDFSGFYWGEEEPHLSFKEFITKETLEDRIYEKVMTVEEGDVVVDIGASIGPFTYSILDKKPSHVYCLEPDNKEFKTLLKNVDGEPVTCIMAGISTEDKNIENGEYSFSKGGDMSTITLKTLFESYGLDRIDFLKTDCEGGEYSLFVKENYELISKIRKITGEWHLGANLKESFRKFRDEYLAKHENFEVYSVDGVNIKWDLFNEHFLDYYTEVIIHIDNR
jgi:FkbM family methyltransferase